MKKIKYFVLVVFVASVLMNVLMFVDIMITTESLKEAIAIADMWRNQYRGWTDIAQRNADLCYEKDCEIEIWKAKYEALATGNITSPYYQEWMEQYYIPRVTSQGRNYTDGASGTGTWTLTLKAED